MRRVSHVSPGGQDNSGLELTGRVFHQTAQQVVGPSGTSVSVVRSVAQWASYARGRWKRAARKCVRKKPSGEPVGSKYKGLAWDEDAVDGDAVDGPDKEPQPNRRLLDHFRVLDTSNEDTDEVDLQYLDGVLAEGADPNSADKYGQTALHEISRAWNVDVMRFFLERGADVLRADAFGVTALHVAAALDYEEMIRFLLEKGADIEARTYKDLQTPLHFAAKNDAIGAIRILLQSDADVGAHDYKHRTALQLAANSERSEAARTLLELGADAGLKDSDGQLCITVMIGKMTPVAYLALNQFHVKDQMTRQQFYYLQLLEPERDSQGQAGCEPISPLGLIVHQGKLDLIMHPVVLKLIAVKWNVYGRQGAWILLLLNFLFIMSWTIVAISVSMSQEEGSRYVLPQDWWRVVVVAVALGLTVLEVYREVMDVLRSGWRLKAWQQWSERRLREDLTCTHPMWPEERHYLEGQIKTVRNLKGSYSQDHWNVFDWLVYILLIAVLGLHLADVYLVSHALRTYSLRLFAVTIIFLWLRLMKHVRAFRWVHLGASVTMVTSARCQEIFIPYACAFWIIFGGLADVPSMQTVPQMLYSLYRITLVDDYEFDAMVAVDSTMAHLLCGTFLALSAVLCVNLMIALLSDTFQRVYDNALANAVMQQATIILQVEETMPRLRRLYDKHYIHCFCAPLGEFYDGDITTDLDQHEEMKKLTAEIKDILDEFLDIQKKTKPPKHSQADKSDIMPGRTDSSLAVQADWHSTLVRLEKDQQQQAQELRHLREDVKKLQASLIQLIQSKATEFGDGPNTSSVVLRLDKDKA
ncbi:uncharacterized protein LOC143485931 isoform X2 [Brachyhypopomus gauderio]|uniref:uncharacterized protein LOC143485931 isoform X2 n=1 Tax=Brachyhypopomus gauderio TaxID=698409 RepID=UPI0040437008